jgi:N-acetylglutamate synthase-like GNAT family acetyltransferase
VQPVISLRPAAADDFAAVEELLVRCALTADGVREQFPDGYAVAWAGEAAAGVAGVERYGRFGLLRSVAVAPDARNLGLAAELLAGRRAWAREHGIESLYLLTTTAPLYFEKAGFRRVERQDVPAEIRASHEFAHACPASAVVMVEDLA